MIPYIQQPTLDLGPFTIHAFGVLVATGILVGYQVFKRRIERTGLDVGAATQLIGWVLVGGFIGAHLVERIFYSFDETLAAPWTLLMVWMGISSYGGFLGAMVGGWLFLRRHPQGADTWRYLDGIAYAFPFGWLFGRAGCFLAFDHVGAPTDFFLGELYRDGVVRHNLGLEEALFTLPLIVLMVILGRKPRPAGSLVGALAVAYAPGRFLLDFLRVDDDRHLGLLVSQYASIVLFLFGLWMLWTCYRRGHEVAPSEADDAGVSRPGDVLTPAPARR